MRCATHMRGRLATLTVALLVLLGLISVAEAQRSAAPAGRLVQPRGEDGCVHRTGINRCADGRRLTSPEDIVISPDGRFAYVAAIGSHALAIFRRDRGTGFLTQLRGRRGCVNHRVTRRPSRS